MKGRADIRSLGTSSNIAIEGLEWGGVEFRAISGAASELLTIACQAKQEGGWTATVIAPNPAGKGNVQIAAIDIG